MDPNQLWSSNGQLLDFSQPWYSNQQQLSPERAGARGDELEDAATSEWETFDRDEWSGREGSTASNLGTEGTSARARRG